MNRHKRNWNRRYGTDILIVLGMGLAFIIFALITLFPPLYESLPWGVYMLFPGLIMIVSYFSSKYAVKKMRREVKGALNSYTTNRIKIAELSDELKINPKDIKRIVIDLRTNGDIKASFDGDTGDIILPELIKARKDKTETVAQSKVEYCPYCGVKIPNRSKFCSSCGASVE